MLALRKCFHFRKSFLFAKIGAYSSPKFSSLSPSTAAQLTDEHKLWANEIVTKQNRAILARAITLIESRRPDLQRQGQIVLKEVLKIRAATQSPLRENPEISGSFRIGISGPPGAGKSSLIEVFGSMLTKQFGLKVAVLAVDPSSTRTRGSILGDKTRMTELSRDTLAYVRPSPTGGTLGGVARNTCDTIVLCEAAGYDVVLVETVGVGQSETAVADMVDLFMLVVPPAAGDELQGLKKGVVELADLVVVNKADGELKAPAIKAQTELISALKILQPKSEAWAPRVLAVSCVESSGFQKLWKTMKEFHQLHSEKGLLLQRRKDQLTLWMWSHIHYKLLDIFKSNPDVKSIVETLENQVLDETITPGYAADKLLYKFLDSKIRADSFTPDS